MSFWKKLFGNKQQSQEETWEEILLNDSLNPLPKPLEKPLLDALTGKINILEAQSLLDAFTEEGWDIVKLHLPKMAAGKIPATTWSLERIFSAFPQESCDLLFPHLQQLSVKNCFTLLAVVGEGKEDEITTAVLEMIPTLEIEDLGGAFDVLSLYPTEKGKAALASHLGHEDWRIAMKAATALEKARGTEYLPQLKELAEKDGILGSGVHEIVVRMEQ